MSLEYIRSYYKVPAYVGMRVRFSSGKKMAEGRITGADGHYLRIDRKGPYHPTWEIQYLNEDGTVLLDAHARDTKREEST